MPLVFKYPISSKLSIVKCHGNYGILFGMESLPHSLPSSFNGRYIVYPTILQGVVVLDKTQLIEKITVVVISESSPLASLILFKEFIQYPIWAEWPSLYTLLLGLLGTLIRLVRFMSLLLARYVSSLQCDVTLHHPHVRRLQTDSIWIISVVCQYCNFITNTIHPDLLLPPNLFVQGF